MTTVESAAHASLPPVPVRPSVIPLRGWLLWAGIPALLIGIPRAADAAGPSLGSMMAAMFVVAGVLAVLASGTPFLLVLVLLGAAFLPSATAGFMAGAVALLLLLMFGGVRRAATSLDGADLAMLGAIGWAVFSWAMNLGRETDVWSLPVSLLLFWTPWLVVFVVRSSGELRRVGHIVAGAWIAFVLVQVAPAAVAPFVLGEPGAFLVPLLPLELVVGRLPGHDAMTSAADLTRGTMISPHHLGVVVMLALAFFLAWYWRVRRGRYLFGAGVLTYLLLMADAKHVVFSAVLVAWPTVMLLLWRELGPPGRRLALAVTFIGVVGVAGLGLVSLSRLARAGLLAPAVEVAAMTPKVKLLTRTAALMRPGELHTWIGYGPGAFASRAASSRAAGALFKEETRLPDFIPTHTPPTYGGVVYDLYTAEIKATIRNRSDVLTSPFSSLLGIVAEYGVLGSLVMSLFLAAVARTGVIAWRDESRQPAWRAFGAALAFAIPLLVVLSVFDSYFEQPDIVIPIAVLWLLASRPA